MLKHVLKWVPWCGWIFFVATLILWRNSSPSLPVLNDEPVITDVPQPKRITAPKVSLSKSEKTEIKSASPLDSAEIRRASADAESGNPAIRKALKMAANQKPEEALQLLLQAAEKDKENEELQTQIGLMYARKLNQPEKAIPYLEKSLAKDPNQPDVLPELVRAYQTPERLKQGQDFLQELSETKHPTAVGPALALADLKSRGGNPNEAALYLEKRARGLQAPGEAYAFAAAIQMGEKGDPAQALKNATLAEEYSKAAVNEKRQRGESTALPTRDLARDQFTKADAYFRLGRPEEGLKILQEWAPQKSPEGEEAVARIEGYKRALGRQTPAAE